MVLFVGTEQSKGYRYLNHLLFTGLELRLCQERTTGYSPVYKDISELFKTHRKSNGRC